MSGRKVSSGKQDVINLDGSLSKKQQLWTQLAISDIQELNSALDYADSHEGNMLEYHNFVNDLNSANLHSYFSTNPDAMEMGESEDITDVAIELNDLILKKEEYEAAHDIMKKLFNKSPIRDRNEVMAQLQAMSLERNSFLEQQFDTIVSDPQFDSSMIPRYLEQAKQSYENSNSLKSSAIEGLRGASRNPFNINVFDDRIERRIASNRISPSQAMLHSQRFPPLFPSIDDENQNGGKRVSRKKTRKSKKIKKSKKSKKNKKIKKSKKTKKMKKNKRRVNKKTRSMKGGVAPPSQRPSTPLSSASSDSSDEYGTNPGHIAALNGDVESLRQWLDTRYTTPYGHVDARNDDGETMLYLASTQHPYTTPGHVEIVRLLLYEYGANLEVQNNGDDIINWTVINPRLFTDDVFNLIYERALEVGRITQDEYEEYLRTMPDERIAPMRER
jgi:hypothetical protein